MSASKSLRNQHLDRLTQQLGTVESKQFLKLRIRTSYPSFQIGYDDGVGRGFVQLFKQHWRVVFPRVPR